MGHAYGKLEIKRLSGDILKEPQRRIVMQGAHNFKT